eukprot:3592091-Prymnesium_polylepis.1
MIACACARALGGQSIRRAESAMGNPCLTSHRNVGNGGERAVEPPGGNRRAVAPSLGAVGRSRAESGSLACMLPRSVRHCASPLLRMRREGPLAPGCARAAPKCMTAPSKPATDRTHARTRLDGRFASDGAFAPRRRGRHAAAENCVGWCRRRTH